MSTESGNSDQATDQMQCSGCGARIDPAKALGSFCIDCAAARRADRVSKRTGGKVDPTRTPYRPPEESDSKGIPAVVIGVAAAALFLLTNLDKSGGGGFIFVIIGAIVLAVLAPGLMRGGR